MAATNKKYNHKNLKAMSKQFSCFILPKKKQPKEDQTIGKYFRQKKKIKIMLNYKNMLKEKLQKKQQK